MRKSFIINIEVVLRILIPYFMLIINGSVFGTVHHTNYICCAYIVLMLIAHRKRIADELQRSSIMVDLYNSIVVMILLIIMCAVLNFHMVNCLFIVMVCSSLLYMDIDLRRNELSFATNILLIFNIVVLLCYHQGWFMAYWNPNQIAMITVSAFYFSLISWNDSCIKGIRILLMGILCWGIWKTESRSIFLGIATALLLMFWLTKINHIKKESLIKCLIFGVSIFPFFVIIWNVFYIESNLSEILNNIFSKFTWKTVYSGRESIWTQWLPQLVTVRYLLIGSGQNIVGNLHSLVLDIWYEFGAVIMLLYIYIQFSAWNKLRYMFQDYFIRACFASFCGMYIAQAFECMSSDTGYFYIFMYVFLSMAIGRSITIYEERGGEIE